MGKRPAELAKATEGLREWLEPRFAARGDGDPRIQCCGLGTLVLCEADFTNDPSVNRLAPLVQTDESWVPTPGRSRSREFDFDVESFRELPRGPFVIALLIFVVLVGPVNFMVAKRRGKPMLLLFTIPAISLFTFLSFLGIALSYQGLDIKIATYSLTVLDQRTHRASTVGHRSMFAGFCWETASSPASGPRSSRSSTPARPSPTRTPRTPAPARRRRTSST